MKAIKKEVLIIVVLAVLATGLSWFIVREVGCPEIKCSPTEESCPMIMCVSMDGHGWPLYYYEGVPHGTITQFLFIFFVIDFIFYFVLFQLIWRVSKRIIKKVI